jgi:hypothetical protein
LAAGLVFRARPAVYPRTAWPFAVRSCHWRGAYARTRQTDDALRGGIRFMAASMPDSLPVWVAALGLTIGKSYRS